MKVQTLAMRTINLATLIMARKNQVDFVVLEPLIREESALMYTDIQFTKLKEKVVAEPGFTEILWSNFLMN